MAQSDSIKNKLAQDLDIAPWSWLIPHYQRDALIMVDPSLEITEVGQCLALDQKSQIETWLNKGLIFKPTVQQVNVFDSDPHKKLKILILQPFVIAQWI